MTNPPPPPAGEYQPTQPLSPSDEKLWSTLIHLGGIVFGFLPALIGYLVLKDRGPFVREHTRAALNFQISYTIYIVALSIVGMVVGGILALVTFGFSLVLVWLLLIAVGIAAVVFMIIAAVRANQGTYYTYPFTIEFIK
jgi:uncharacterized Tic20 family protein